MQRRAFLAAALLLATIPRTAFAQRDAERRRLDGRTQERREERRRDEERANERRERCRESEELADERREERRAREIELRERRDELNTTPAPPHTPTRPLDQPIPPAQ